MKAVKILTVLGVIVLLLIGAGLVLQVTRVPESSYSHQGYTTNAGELIAGSLVGQTFVAPSDNLSAVAVKFATYSGRKNTEPVVFNLRRGVGDERDIRTATVNPATLGDNQMHRFSFEPIADSADQTFFFYVESAGSSVGNAVTVDLDTRDPYYQGTAFLVRGKGGQSNAPDTIATSGKPTIDVAFELYHEVPLGVAGWNKVKSGGRNFVTTWDDQRSKYILWAQIGVPAVLIIAMLLGGAWLAKTPTQILIGMFLLAVLVRVLYALELPITNDEGNYLYDAASLLRGKLAGGDGYVKAPLVVLWVAGWELFGSSVLMGRLSSVVIGAATLWPIYILGRELARPFSRDQGKVAGLAAAGLWALLGVTTVFNVYVHTQPLAIFFGVSGLAVLFMALRGTTPKISLQSIEQRPATDSWFIIAGVLLGLGVVSRKSTLALGLVPVLLILLEGKTISLRLRHFLYVGLGFIVIIGLFLTFAGFTYGVEGFWEAVGVNSAVDGLNAVTVDEIDQVRAYSLRGMTPFFRESLPLILLSLLGLGFALERSVTRVLPKLNIMIAKLSWLAPIAAGWWAWGFFDEYEGSSVMIFEMEALWYAMAAVLLLAVILPSAKPKQVLPRDKQPWPGYITAALLTLVWIGGLVFFYMNWIKFHANYIGEFLPALVVLGGFGGVELYRRLVATDWSKLRMASGIVRAVMIVPVTVIVLWALFTSGYVTYKIQHTGTFGQSAVKEAAQWAKDNIPADQTIFTGAAVVPYLSGHETALNIAHPRWYAYEFTRTDTVRLGTFLPSAEEMVQAYRDAEWFLLDKQTGFSFLMEYSEIEAGLASDWESVKGISNGSNTLTFYKRIR